MIIKSNLSEYIVVVDSLYFRVARFGDRYIIENIELPCNDLKYICEFDTLGQCIEYLLTKYE